MYLFTIYFILGLAMFLVVLWDYKYLPKTAGILTKQAEKNASSFSLVVLAVRNLLLMALFALFLWPVIVVIELSGEKEERSD